MIHSNKTKHNNNRKIKQMEKQVINDELRARLLAEEQERREQFTFSNVMKLDRNQSEDDLWQEIYETFAIGLYPNEVHFIKYGEDADVRYVVDTVRANL